ncbi:MAG: sugar transferase [Solobacterium sp.]|nr:sugar transferase [Solobacterium sp.]
MYHRRARGWMKHGDFFVVDAITVSTVLLMLYGILYKSWLYNDPSYLHLWIFAVISDAVVFLVFDTMHNVLQRGYYAEVKDTLKHCTYVFAGIMIILFSTKTAEDYSIPFLYLTYFLHIVLGYATRLFWKWFVRNHHTPVSQKRLMLALLNRDAAEKTMKRINHSPVKNFEITGVILNAKSGPSMVDGVPVVAFIDDAAKYICQESVDALYVDCLISDPAVADLISACMQMGVPIHYHVPSIFSEESKTFFEKIGGDMTLTSTLNYLTLGEQIAKRVLDIIGGLVGCLITVILFLVIGPMIKIASPGPILFAQERIGLNGRHFKMYKFRSMHMDAEGKKQDLMKENRVADGMMFKVDNDPRIIGNRTMPDGTCRKGIGDFIRRTSLDEFPQFFNVLMGQMSLVGTRPPTLDEWERYEYHHRARLACKPGITGLWQISGRSDITDFEEIVKLDMQYIMNWSLGLDILILLKTIKVVLFREGAL